MRAHAWRHAATRPLALALVRRAPAARYHSGPPL